jgi:PKD repeat protein
MRRFGILVVIGLVVSGGYAAAQTADAPVTITDATDADCDGRYTAFDLEYSLFYDTSADVLSRTDAYVVVEYATESGYSELIKRDDVSGGRADGTVSVTASDFAGIDGETHVRVSVYDADLTADERLRTAETDTIRVEPSSQDVGALDPTFEWSPSSPRLGQSVSFTASTNPNNKCVIENWRWDIDGDGTVEATGKTISHTFDRDGYHTIELTIVDSRGKTESVLEDLLVVFDPDGDGITNAIERDRGTDPNDIDTDDDLFADGRDPAPTSFLFPTGLVHIVLSVVVYLGTLRRLP